MTQQQLSDFTPVSSESGSDALMISWNQNENQVFWDIADVSRS